MQQRLKIGFAAGLLGALLLIVLIGILQVVGMGAPAFVNIYQTTFGVESMAAAWIVGAVLFAISGGIWGLLFTALVRYPAVWKGMLFGILPALWLWLVVAPFIGQEVFFGFAPMKLLLPFVFNVLIWGAFVGWYTSRRLAVAVLGEGESGVRRSE